MPVRSTATAPKRGAKGAKPAATSRKKPGVTKTAKAAKVGRPAKAAVPPDDSRPNPADGTPPAATPAIPPRTRGPGGRRRSAVDRLDDPPAASGLELIVRVSRAIEHELLQIERIVGGRHVPLMQRSEAERRARTLASLARTLNEVKRLRAEEEKPKADDDDAVPRDLDEFRRELSRRLALLDAGAAPPAAGGDE